MTGSIGDPQQDRVRSNIWFQKISSHVSHKPFRGSPMPFWGVQNQGLNKTELIVFVYDKKVDMKQ